MSLTNPFITDIKSLLQTARNRAYQAVNTAMVEAYWQIGKRIVEEEQKGYDRASYGEGMIIELSQELTSDFGKGFSTANLKNFRQFYLTFPKSYAVRSFLTWTHYRLIMRLQDEGERNFYLEETAHNQWSTRQLERSIKTNLFKRIPKTKTSEQDFQTKSNVLPNDFVKDPYVFEFLNIPQPSELSELEKALISHLQKFLLEMGKGFAFVGRQFRISSETSHFYIDLVFYNYILKCFVLVDLKTEKLSHQDIGQMDMYVRMFDDLKKGEGDNPTVGLILCSDKDETVVKYSILSDKKQLFASKYFTCLPSEQELKDLIENDRLLLEPMIKYGKSAF